MTWPLLQLAVWHAGRGPSPEIGGLIADPGAPLGQHGLAVIAESYARRFDATIHEEHLHWARELAARTLAIDGTLLDVVPVLREHDVPFFVAKGPASLDQSRPLGRLRCYSDLDLYLEDRDVPRAIEVLTPLGFEQMERPPSKLDGRFYELVGGRFGATVELHVTACDTIVRRHLPSLDRYFDHVVDRQIFGIDVPVLTPGAHLALHAIHFGASHRFAKLSCLRDVIALAPEADSPAIDELGARPYLDAAIELSRHAGLDVFEGRSRSTAVGRGLRRSLGTDPRQWDELEPTMMNLRALLHGLGPLQSAGVLAGIAIQAGRRARLEPIPSPRLT